MLSTACVVPLIINLDNPDLKENLAYDMQRKQDIKVCDDSNLIELMTYWTLSICMFFITI